MKDRFQHVILASDERRYISTYALEISQSRTLVTLISRALLKLSRLVVAGLNWALVLVSISTFPLVREGDGLTLDIESISMWAARQPARERF